MKKIRFTMTIDTEYDADPANYPKGVDPLEYDRKQAEITSKIIGKTEVLDVNGFDLLKFIEEYNLAQDIIVETMEYKQ